MNVPLIHARSSRRSRVSPPHTAVVAGRKAYRLGLICGSMALLLASTAGGGLQRTGQWPQLPPDAVRVPDAVDQSKINEQNLDKQSFEVINAERKKQISNDSSRLLQLAIDLKAEVDKTSKDTLSVNVIRKADAIEKLAHNVKEKMKMSIGSN